jgi:hypothetical protein
MQTSIVNKMLLIFSLIAISCGKSKVIPAPVPIRYEINFKFSDASGNNLLNAINESDLSEYIKVTSGNGKIISNVAKIAVNGNQKYLTVQSLSFNDEFLKTINYTVKNDQLTGAGDGKTIQSNWVVVKNSPSVNGVFVDEKEISPSKDQQSGNFTYYTIVKIK